MLSIVYSRLEKDLSGFKPLESKLYSFILWEITMMHIQLFCKRYFSFGLFGILLVLSASLNAENAPLRVFVSVIPQQYFAQQVGGELIVAEAMVQPGFSPATYELTGKQIARLAKADVYVRVGVPFENAWMKQIRAANQSMLLLDAREGLEPRVMEAHTPADEEATTHHSEHEHAADEVEHAEHEHKHENELDPHIWTSPRITKQMAAQLRDVFSQLRPEHTEQFAANYERFAAELDRLDTELQAFFAEHVDVKQFMVFHPAWGYFADAYDLRQIPIEFEGKEPSAKALAELINHAKAAKVKAIFVQPQFSRRAAQQLAKAIDGKVIAINPLARNYIENLREVAHTIVGEESAKE